MKYYTPKSTKSRNKIYDSLYELGRRKRDSTLTLYPVKYYTPEIHQIQKFKIVVSNSNRRAASTGALVRARAARHRGRTTVPTDYSEPDFPLFSPLFLKSDVSSITNRTSHFGVRPISVWTSCGVVQFENASLISKERKNKIPI